VNSLRGLQVNGARAGWRFFRNPTYNPGCSLWAGAFRRPPLGVYEPCRGLTFGNLLDHLGARPLVLERNHAAVPHP